MILHTVNKSACLGRCLDLVADGDAVLLIEDGVYAAMGIPGQDAAWDSLSGKVACFALDTDLAARGISGKMHPRFRTATWQQFVALAAEADKVVSWG